MVPPNHRRVLLAPGIKRRSDCANGIIRQSHLAAAHGSDSAWRTLSSMSAYTGGQIQGGHGLTGVGQGHSQRGQRFHCFGVGASGDDSDPRSTRHRPPVACPVVPAPPDWPMRRPTPWARASAATSSEATACRNPSSPNSDRIAMAERGPTPDTAGQCDPNSSTDPAWGKPYSTWAARSEFAAPCAAAQVRRRCRDR